MSPIRNVGVGAALVCLGMLAYSSYAHGTLWTAAVWAVRMQGAILLTVFAFYYILDGGDEAKHSKEDIAAGMSIKEYVLKRYRSDTSRAPHFLKLRVDAQSTNLEWETAFTWQILGLGILHCCFVLTILGHVVAGVEPRLGLVAAFAASIAAVKKIGYARALDTFKMRMTWNVRDTLLHAFMYCVPPVYVLIVLLEYVF